MSRILCVTYGAGHAQIIGNVVPELIARGHDVEVLALTTAAGQLARKGIKSLGFVDFLNEDDAAALELGKQITAKSADHADMRPGETAAYLGICYSELVQDYGSDEAQSRFVARGRQAFLPKRFIRRVFDQLKPDLVVTTNSPRSEQAAIEVAHEMNVPSVVIVDLLAEGDGPRLQQPTYGTKVCVIAEVVRQRLVSLGRDSGDVVVTGNPAFDDLWAESVASDAETLRKVKGWGDDKVILWASQPEPTDPLWGCGVADELAQAMAEKQGWRLVFRPHPNEGPKEKLTTSKIETSGQDDNLAALLKAVDAVVVVSSTVGLQAAILGKLVVQMTLPVSAEPIDYSSIGAGFLAPNIQECVQVLEKHIGQDQTPTLGFVTPRDATKKVADTAGALLLQTAR